MVELRALQDQQMHNTFLQKCSIRLPVSIFFVVDSFVKDPDNNLTTAKLKLAKAVLYLLQFSNYAVNFFIFIEVLAMNGYLTHSFSGDRY
jgi:hypothetical protein